MKKYTTEMVKALILSGFVSIGLIGCGGDDNGTGPEPEEPAFNIQTVSTQSHGDVLADGEGKVLYLFTPDVKGESTCEGGCLGNWPVYYVEQLDPGEGINAADFGTITRADGDMQTTYKGWPLYYFANDAQPGDINGDGNGDKWYVAKPDYSLMIAEAQLVDADGNNYYIDDSGAYVEGDSTTTYFTDAEGRTLYAFANDAANSNNCTSEGCINAWPVFHVEIEALPSGMNTDDFGEFTAHGDRQQLTYKGWPVYYFTPDEERGDNKGVGVGLDLATGEATWPIINADTPEAPSPNVQIASTQSLGDVLTDSVGNVLYFFTPDVKGESTCEGGCVDNWPIFDAGDVRPGTGLNPANFGTITRTDGSSQTTFKGWPLYYYIGDAQPGDINGDGAGGKWYVAKPDYSLMIASAQLVGADGNNYIINESDSSYVVGDGATTYFTDIEGRTLYTFASDAANTNTCTGGCIDAWPVFHVEIGALPSGMNEADFGEFTAHGDRQQLTYKGWPVYYFTPDAERGDNKGVSVGLSDMGEAAWPIINDAYTPDAPTP